MSIQSKYGGDPHPSMLKLAINGLPQTIEVLQGYDGELTLAALHVWMLRNFRFYDLGESTAISTAITLRRNARRIKYATGPKVESLVRRFVLSA